MAEDEDIKMGETRELPTLPSHASLTHAPSSANPEGRTNPALAPSPIKQNLPQGSSPGPGPVSTLPSTTLAGPMAPERPAKLSDSESTSAEHLLRRDSLVESNSDWSEDEDDMSKPGLAVGSLPTGLCYDPRMRWHCEVNPSSDVHPEDPRRIYYIYRTLCKAGLVDDPSATRPLAPQTLKRIDARRAQEAEIILVHTEAHYAFVKGTRSMILNLDPLFVLWLISTLTRH